LIAIGSFLEKNRDACETVLTVDQSGEPFGPGIFRDAKLFGGLVVVSVDLPAMACGCRPFHEDLPCGEEISALTRARRGD
jgi:hypothetical protein